MTFKCQLTREIEQSNINNDDNISNINNNFNDNNNDDSNNNNNFNNNSDDNIDFNDNDIDLVTLLVAGHQSQVLGQQGEGVEVPLWHVVEDPLQLQHPLLGLLQSSRRYDGLIQPWGRGEGEESF